MFKNDVYRAAIHDLRALLRAVGRHEFRAYGYWPQIQQYRLAMRGSLGTSL